MKHTKIADTYFVYQRPTNETLKNYLIQFEAYLNKFSKEKDIKGIRG